MKQYRVTDQDGQAVNPGDIVTDFRGNSGRFEGAVWADRSFGTSGARVIVSGKEALARMYNLTVETLSLENAYSSMDVRTAECSNCGESSYVTVSKVGFGLWKNGKSIFNSLPLLTPTERELLVSGIHAECWDELFPAKEEDEDFDYTDDDYRSWEDSSFYNDEYDCF